LRLSFIIVSLIFVFPFLGILEEKAYAYLDPGTGSYFFQIIIAAVIGGAFALKMFWAKIIFSVKKLFIKKKKHG